MNMPLKEKYEFVYREVILDEYDDFDIFLGEKRVYSIGIKDKDGFEYPHPITDFIRENRSSSMSLERERQIASSVTQFLNYIIQMIHSDDPDFKSLEQEGFYGLNFLHASLFLQYADNQNSYRRVRVKKDTVDRKENVLVLLYVFLQKHNIICKNLQIPFYVEKGKTKYSSPFLRKRGNSNNETVRKDLRDFGENRQQLLIELIDTALSLKKGKPIAFGIALQGLGGLRRGEVVNLTTGSLSYVGNSLVADIKDRQNKLFPNKKNTTKERVKKPRVQDILPSEFIDQLLQTYFNWLENKRKRVQFKVQDALFVNKAGYPMSGKSYETTFKRVITVFLDRLLENGRFEEHAYLTSKPLNTHTLRGVFTNICLDDLNMNIRQTANARGDNWDTSVFEYVEELTGKQKMQKAVEQLAKAVVDASSAKDVISNWSKKENQV